MSSAYPSALLTRPDVFFVELRLRVELTLLVKLSRGATIIPPIDAFHHRVVWGESPNFDPSGTKPVTWLGPGTGKTFGPGTGHSCTLQITKNRERGKEEDET